MQLDHLAITILKEVATDPGLSVDGLCQRIGLRQRNFYYRWGKINDWLSQQDFSPLTRLPDSGLRFGVGESGPILKKIAQLGGPGYKLRADERRDHILLFLVCSHVPQFTQSVSLLNHVSRNTTLHDLQLLKESLKREHGLTLSVSRKKGYQITGNALQINLCVMQTLQHTLKYADGQAEKRITGILLSQLQALGVSSGQVQQVTDKAIAVAGEYLWRDFTDKDKRLMHHMVLFCLLQTQQGKLIIFSPAQVSWLRRRPECEAAALLNARLTEALGCKPHSCNTLFFCLLLSTSKSLNSQPGNGEEDRRLIACIHRLIDDFQSLSGVYFVDISRLVTRLFAHLGPALQRCLFHIHSENVLRQEVIQRYPLIFRLCRQAVAGLEQAYQVVFSDDELSYIAISFAAWLDKRRETREQSLLLVTEGGLSSTALLENQLRNLTIVPLAIEHFSVSQLEHQGVPEDTRLVVSTVALPQGKYPGATVIRVQHMLDAREKLQLRLLLESGDDASPSEQLPHKKTLAEYLQGRVSYCGRHPRWRAAVQLAARPLLEQGVIGQEYVAQIVATIEREGLNRYLSAWILLLHAEPPKQSGTGALSLLKLKHPLQFDDVPVSINPLMIVVLVPSCNLSHIGLLEALNEVVSDESRLERLLKASSCEGVLAAMQ
ncbi:PRD domain-containing protein [Erwinia amylovora]